MSVGRYQRTIEVGVFVWLYTVIAKAGGQGVMLYAQLHTINPTMHFTEQFTTFIVFSNDLCPDKGLEIAFALAQLRFQVGHPGIVVVVKLPGFGVELYRAEVQAAGAADAPETIGLLIADF